MEIEKMLADSKALTFGDFTLASGRKSSYYVDIKKSITDPAILKAIAKELSKHVANEKIAGIELGSVPIAVALSLETSRPYLIIRKEEKGYGTQRLVEGVLNRGDKVVIVDDVATTGKSIIRAANILRGEGAVVEKALVVVDREEGAEQNLAEAGLKMVSVVKVSNLMALTRK
ncbi:MAG: orotate phosphoribosyltransferase [Candidatus Micrarchaeaceae archaeon]